MNKSQPISNKQRTEQLNSLGILVISKLLGVSFPSGKYTSLLDQEGKSVKVKVQNHWNHPKHGKCFTIDVDDNSQSILGHDRVFFVDYDDQKSIQVFECSDKAAYVVEYANGGASYPQKGMKRIVMCFQAEKMVRLAEIVDVETHKEMKQLSDARKFNIGSSHYSAAA